MAKHKKTGQTRPSSSSPRRRPDHRRGRKPPAGKVFRKDAPIDLLLKFMDDAEDGVLAADAETQQFVYGNRAICSMLGRSPDEITSLGVGDIHPAADLAKVRATFGQQAARQLSLAQDIPVIRKDGEVFLVDISSHPVTVRGRTYLVGVFRDASVRRATERTLKESEARFRFLFERAPDAIFTIGPDARVSSLSPAFRQITGYTPEEWIGRPFAEILHPEDLPLAMEMFTRVIRGETPSPFELRVKSGAGTWLVGEFTATPWTTGDGRTEVFGIGRDVTERRQIERAIRESGERYRAFIAQSTEGIWRLELDEPIPVNLPEDAQINLLYERGYFAECNDAMARMYGLPDANAFVGSRMTDFMPRNDPKNAGMLLSALRNGYRITDAESCELDADGNVRHFLNNFVGIVKDGKLQRAWGTQQDITDRKRTEKALEESEGRFRSLVERSLAGIYVIQDDRFVYANVKAAEIFGLSAGGLDGRPIHDFVAPEDRALVAEKVRLRIAEGVQSVHYQYTGLRADGARISVEVLGSKMDLGGRPALIGTLMDVTERERAEAALRESKQFTESLVESLPYGISVIAADGTRTNANRALCEMLGYTRDELIGQKPPFPFWAPDQIEKIRAEFDAMREGRLKTTELVFQRKNGERFPVAVFPSYIRDATGAITSIIVSFQDIADRRRDELALRQSEERYRALAESSQDFIFIVGRDRRVEYVNELAAREFGCRPVTVVGRNVHELFPEEIARRQWSSLEKVFSSGEAGSIENFTRFPSRSLWLDTWLVPLKSADGSVRSVLGVSRDFTRRKEAEDELRRKSSEFEAIFQALPDLYFKVDADGTILDYKAGQTSELFVPPEAFLGRRVIDVLPGGTAARLTEAIAAVVESRVMRSVEYALPMPSGEEHYEARLAPLGESQVVVFIRNVTDRKRAETALIDTERYQALFERSLDCVYLHDFSGRILDANNAMLSTLGYTARELVGLQFSDILDPEGAESARRVFLEIERTGSHRGLMEYRLRRKDGTFVHIETKASAVYREGKAWAIQGVARNVTQRKRAESALRQSEFRFRELYEKYKNIVESSPDAIVVTDLGGVLVDCNQPAVEMYGARTKAEFIGLNLFDRVAAGDRDRASEMIRSVLEGTFVRNAEFSVVRRDGTEFAAEVSASLARDARGEPSLLIGIVTDITERKKAEAALRDSEEKFRALAENSYDTIMRFDREHRHLYANPAVEPQTGIPPWRFIGKTHRELGFPAHLCELWEEAISRVFETRRPCRVEFELPTHIWIDWLLIPEFNPAGDVASVVTSARDITGRKNAEAAIKQSEERYRELYQKYLNILDSSPDAITLTDLEGRIIDCNRRTVAMHGADSKQEIVGSNSFDLIVESDRPKALEGLKKTLSAGAIQNVEYSLYRRDGTEFPAELSASLIRDASGNPVAFVGIVKDITERKRAEAALRDSEDKFRTLFESSRDSIMTLEPPSWRFTSGNPATVRMFRTKDAAEFESYEPWRLSPERQPDGRASSDKAIDMIETAMKNGSNFFEWTHKRIDGEEFPASVLLTRVEQGGRRFLQATVRDLTEHKRLEQQAIQTEKMAAIGTLVAGLSHELNNPIGVILGYAQSLLKHAAAESAIRPAIVSIEREAQRCASLVRVLLDFSRKSPAPRQRVGVAALARRVAETVRDQAASRGVRLTVEDRGDQGPPVYVNVTEIESAILNLVNNGLDAAAAAAGAVSVGVEPASHEGTAGARITVRDTGAGIPAQLQVKVFEPFFTTKPVGKGTGLGLSLTRQIVESHGGRVTFESAPGAGTTFKLWLPGAPDSDVK